MSRNILLVSDSRFSRLQLQRDLIRNDYNVFEATRGRQVINNAFHPETGLSDLDLVLLDLYLEDFPGEEVLKVLVGKNPSLPVIIIGSGRSREEIIKVIDMGASDYLVRPVDSSLLLERVQNVLEKKEKTPAKEVTVREEKNRLESLLLEEIERALRSEAPLIILKIESDTESLEKLYQLARDNLRRIDSVVLLESAVILTLPATNVEGSEVVEEKLFSIGEKELNRDQLEIKKLMFPRDTEKELIDEYRVEEIFRNFIEQLTE